MRRISMVLFAVLLIMLVAAPALAHVTVQPNEAEAGSFSRFVVRVPNERDEASTTRVEVQLPENLTSVSFQPKEGWERTVEMTTLDEPIEVFGQEVTEAIGTVTWRAARSPRASSRSSTSRRGHPTTRRTSPSRLCRPTARVRRSTGSARRTRTSRQRW